MEDMESQDGKKSKWKVEAIFEALISCGAIHCVHNEVLMCCKSRIPKKGLVAGPYKKVSKT